MLESGTVDGCKWRKAIIVKNNSSQTVTNIPIKIVLTRENFPYQDVRPDGADIRFTLDDGTTKLSYWVEKWERYGTSVIWVKLPILRANETIRIWLNYCNSSLSSESNGENVFKFFDHFDGSAINTDKWDVPNATGISVANSQLKYTNTSAYLRTRLPFNPSLEIVCKHKVVSYAAHGHVGLGLYATPDYNYTSFAPMYDYNTLIIKNGEATTQNISPVNMRKWCVARIKFHAGTVTTNIVDEDGNETTFTDQMDILNAYVQIGKRYDGVGEGESCEVYWDYVYVRDVIEPEPTVTVPPTELNAQLYRFAGMDEDPLIIIDNLESYFNVKFPLRIQSYESESFWFKLTLEDPPPEASAYTQELGKLAYGDVKDIDYIITFTKPTSSKSYTLKIKIEAYQDEQYTQFFSSKTITIPLHLYYITDLSVFDFTNFEDMSYNGWDVGGTNPTKAISSEKAVSGIYSMKFYCGYAPPNQPVYAYKKYNLANVTGTPYLLAHVFNTSDGFWVEIVTPTQTITKIPDWRKAPSGKWIRLCVELPKQDNVEVRIRVMASTTYPSYLDDVGVFLR